MSTPAPPAQPAGVARQVRNGLGWSFVNTAVGRLGTLVSGIVLARLLTPEDYGVFAVALVALTGLLSMNELGVSIAVVRWQGDPRPIIPTVATLSVAGSVLLYAGCFAAAPAIATAMSAPEATGVLRLLCLGVVVDGLTAVPAALLTRRFQQRRRTGVDLSNLVVGTGLAMALAVGGLGAWSLAWGRLAGNAVSALLLSLLSPGGYRFGFDRSQARALLAFGMPLAGSSLLVFFMLNLDYLVVGALLGPVALGLYQLAFNLSSWPVNVFSTTVRRVSLAGFSRLQGDPEALRTGFSRSLGLLTGAAVPACVLLAVLADPLVRFVYGDKWAGAAPALRFLAVLGLARVVSELAYDYLVAAGRARTALFLQLLWAATLVPVLALGARAGGIEGVGAAHAAVSFGLMLPAFAIALARAGLPLPEITRHLARPLAGGLLAALAAFAALRLPGTFWPLAAGGTAAFALYAPIIAPMRHLLPARASQ